MVKGRAIELIQGFDGKLSPSRLQALGGWFVATVVILYCTINNKLTTDMWAAYLLYSCGQYTLNAYHHRKIITSEISNKRKSPHDSDS